ncbi:MAG: SCP2 sterol-binding domain-containing protein [Actinomycetota bacterium]
MPKFATPQWLEAYMDAINSDADIAEAAKGWEWDIALVVEAEPEKGIPVDLWGLFVIRNGRCEDARVVTADEGDRATFVIRAPYTRWKEVILGKLDPIKGMLQGKLKVAGDLPTLAREVKAADALVKIARAVTTEFPDS